jgi:hypothetical protein
MFGLVTRSRRWSQQGQTNAFAACPGNRHTLRVLIQKLNDLKLPFKVLCVAFPGICSYGSCLPGVGRHSHLPFLKSQEAPVGGAESKRHYDTPCSQVIPQPSIGAQ